MFRRYSCPVRAEYPASSRKGRQVASRSAPIQSRTVSSRSPGTWSSISRDQAEWSRSSKLFVRVVSFQSQVLDLFGRLAINLGPVARPNPLGDFFARSPCHLRTTPELPKLVFSAPPH